MGCSTSPEDALAQALELLAPPTGPVFAAEAKSRKLRAIAFLSQAVQHGNESIGTASAKVPRARPPQMLGFSCLLEPLIAKLGDSLLEELPHAVLLLCDDMAGPSARAVS